MSRAMDSSVSETISPSRGMPAGKMVCPYCGAVSERSSGACPRCTMEDTPATRAATKARIGPWYVLQSRNPSAPGMKWATLLSLVNKGQITPRTIVRGPTTHQLWRFAGHVKGLSREFGICYSCGVSIEKTINQCPQCDRIQEPPINPDALLETREPAPRAPIQREIRPANEESTTLAIREEELPGSRDWRPDAGILSARELAAAFQLDFKPANPDVVATTEKRPSLGKTIAALILLAAVGTAAVLYFKPEYRDAVTSKLQDGGNWVKAQWTRIGTSDKPDPLKDLNKPVSKPVVESKPIQVKPFQPEKPQVAPQPPKQENPAQQATPAPMENSQAADADPFEQSRQLWRQVWEAKQRGDAAAGVRLIEQIKKLPSETWPKVNLDQELEAFRAGMK